jgi:rubredoxin
MVFVTCARSNMLMIHLCAMCEYKYDQEKGDPKNGIAPGTPFSEIPDEWKCPLCGAPKKMFKRFKKEISENIYDPRKKPNFDDWDPTAEFND